MTKTKEESELVTNSDQLVFADKIESLINPNRSLEKASCQFLMTAIRKTALYMFGL